MFVCVTRAQNTNERKKQQQRVQVLVGLMHEDINNISHTLKIVHRLFGEPIFNAIGWQSTKAIHKLMGSTASHKARDALQALTAGLLRELTTALLDAKDGKAPTKRCTACTHAMECLQAERLLHKQNVARPASTP